MKCCLVLDRTPRDLELTCIKNHVMPDSRHKTRKPFCQGLQMQYCVVPDTICKMRHWTRLEKKMFCLDPSAQG